MGGGVGDVAINGCTDDCSVVVDVVDEADDDDNDADDDDDDEDDDADADVVNNVDAKVVDNGNALFNEPLVGVVMDNADNGDITHGGNGNEGDASDGGDVGDDSNNDDDDNNVDEGGGDEDDNDDGDGDAFALN